MNKIQEHFEKVKSLEQDNLNLKAENERLTDENNFLQEEVSRITFTKTDENPFVDEYVFTLKAQVKSLESENLNLKNTAERLNDEIGYLQQKNEALQSECEGLTVCNLTSRIKT